MNFTAQIGVIPYIPILCIFYSHYAIIDLPDNFGVLFSALMLYGLIRKDLSGISHKTIWIAVLFAAINTVFALSLFIQQCRSFPHAYYEQYRREYLELPQNAIILTMGDEINVFWYFREVQDLRRDISIIGVNFMNHKWYESYFVDDKIQPVFFNNWRISAMVWRSRIQKSILNPYYGQYPIYTLSVSYLNQIIGWKKKKLI